MSVMECMPLLITEFQALLEEHEKNEDSIDLALDRITEADDVDDQVEREIRRYWNDRVKTGRKYKSRLRRLRLAILR